MTTPERIALLQDLAGVVHENRVDPETGGREALRLLQAAGAAWRDLLGPPTTEDGYLLLRSSYGVTSQADCAAIISKLISRATPIELGQAAVLANLRAPTAEQFAELAALTRWLVETPEETAINGIWLPANKSWMGTSV